MVNSMRKGKGFERQVANCLTKQTGVKWQRVPMSGAFSTVNRSNDARFFGDVFTEDPKFAGLVVECKKTKEPIMIGEIVNPKSRITAWLDQTAKEAKTKDWILIFGWNNSKMYFFTQNKSVIESLNINKLAIQVGSFWFGLFK